MSCVEKRQIKNTKESRIVSTDRRRSKSDSQKSAKKMIVVVTAGNLLLDATPTPVD
jgi:hypothetical protein